MSIEMPDGTMIPTPRREPQIQCLFCTFTGTKADLIAHSRVCKWHPLWDAMMAERERLNQANLDLAGMRIDLAEARAKLAEKASPK